MMIQRSWYFHHHYWWTFPFYLFVLLSTRSTTTTGTAKSKASFINAVQAFNTASIKGISQITTRGVITTSAKKSMYPLHAVNDATISVNSTKTSFSDDGTKSNNDDCKKTKKSNMDNNNFRSLGKTIQSMTTTKTRTRTTATTIEEALSVCNDFWLPTDENLPHHYKHQLIHHETRQRWASQLLEKFALLVVTVPSTASITSKTLATTTATATIPLQDILYDKRFVRLVWAAAMPFTKTDSKILTTCLFNDDENEVVPNEEKQDEQLDSDGNEKHDILNNISVDRIAKEGKWILDSLHALHTMIGRVAMSSSTSSFSGIPTSSSSSSSPIVASFPLIKPIQLLMLRAYHLVEPSNKNIDYYTLDQALMVHWSMEGLKRLLPDLQKGYRYEEQQHPQRQEEEEEEEQQLVTIDGYAENDVDGDMDDNDGTTGSRMMERRLWHGQQILCRRISRLPFQIIPQGLDWTSIIPPKENDVDDDYDDDGDNKTPDGDDDDDDRILSSNYQSYVCQELIHVIPFANDVLVTKQGNSVRERRGTAWITASNKNIGALAYSGKLMVPNENIPSVVQQVITKVEKKLSTLSLLPISIPFDDDISSSSSLSLKNPSPPPPPTFFDCALCNHYATADSACKFHTDPEHGSHWHRTTVVVAAGSDRKFAFKPIGSSSSTTSTSSTGWDDWDCIENDDGDDDYKDDNGRESNVNGNKKAAFVTLFPGDLVVMYDDCNDEFYHAVYAGDNEGDACHDSTTAMSSKQHERVSLVLKHALDRGGGRKGHGLHGQGRRGRRQRRRHTDNDDGQRISNSHVKTEDQQKQQQQQQQQRRRQPRPLVSGQKRTGTTNISITKSTPSPSSSLSSPKSRRKETNKKKQPRK